MFLKVYQWRFHLCVHSWMCMHGVIGEVVQECSLQAAAKSFYPAGGSMSSILIESICSSVSCPYWPLHFCHVASIWMCDAQNTSNLHDGIDFANVLKRILTITSHMVTELAGICEVLQIIRICNEHMGSQRPARAKLQVNECTWVYLESVYICPWNL